MANLSTLIENKKGIARSIVDLPETNLEKGTIYLFAGTEYGVFNNGFCWKAPGNGRATIEIWGAAGSGALMCCCGIGLPGNPGAYAKRTVNVTASSFVCGNIGCAPGTAGLCFTGCGGPTNITVCTSNCICMCAQGGLGGFATCNNGGSSSLTCFNACNFCITNISNGCGIVCNIGSTFSWLPSAFGGEINCGGGFSCLYIGSCNPSDWHCFSANVRLPAGIISTTQQDVCVPYTCASGSPFGGAGNDNYYTALSAFGRSPTGGGTYRSCWNGSQYCGCYETQTCIPFLPAAIPGLGATPCSGVRDGGIRGGSGKVKITYISA